MSHFPVKVFASSLMELEERETLSELIKSPTCCQGLSPDIFFEVTNHTHIIDRKPRLSDMMRLLKDVIHNWYTIGIALCVPYSVREGLQTSNKTNETRMGEILQYWLDNGTRDGAVPATWDVLISSIDNNKAVVSKICLFLGEG